jgi:hypothetical protein
MIKGAVYCINAPYVRPSVRPFVHPPHSPSLPSPPSPSASDTEPSPNSPPIYPLVRPRQCTSAERELIHVSRYRAAVVEKCGEVDWCVVAMYVRVRGLGSGVGRSTGWVCRASVV